MTEAGVLDLLGSIEVGTVVAWVLAISVIIVTIYKFNKKAYTAVSTIEEFIKKNEEKEKRDEEYQRRNEEYQKRTDERFQNIENIVMADHEYKYTNLRHQIVVDGESCIDKGCISIRKLKSLNELYDQYSAPGLDGVVHNGYVRTLMNKVNKLRVVGQLDEHGEDIDD